MEIWYALAAAFAVMLVSLSGVVFASGRIGTWVQKYLTYLATLSGGVFLLIAYHLAEEAVHEGGWVVGVGSVALGAALMEGIHYFFPLDHHHHEHEESHTHSSVDGRKVLASDALHNIGDGILLVGAFAADLWVGIAATVGVILHEMVQEISEYFVLRESGLTNMQALTRNFAVSSTILIGFVFAAFASSGPLVAFLSGLAAGGFLSVIFHDLVPHAYHSVRRHGGGAIHVTAALIGAGVMFALQTALPHEEHGEEIPHTAVVHTETAAHTHVAQPPEHTHSLEATAPTSSGGVSADMETHSEESHANTTESATTSATDQVQTAGTRN